MADKTIYDTIEKVEPINKGLSGDKKYCATVCGGTKYLLRIMPIEKYETWKILFAILERVAALGVSMCKSVELGTCDDGIYVMQDWIDGEDLFAVLPTLSESEQYVLGIKAGKILRVIHSIPAPEGQENWAKRFSRIIDDKMKKYHECEVKVDGGENFINYIEQNRGLLENRPQCFQHGDYHLGNIIMERGELKIIDFDRCTFSDPWLEFNRIVWGAKASPHFATGQIRGYFGGEPPSEFFKIMALYIATYQLGHVSWAQKFGESAMNAAKKDNEEALRWFDNMQNPVPTWYLKDFYVQYIDEVPCKLQEPFDFSFLSEYGKVFKVFDEQNSGNICFGVSNGKNKYFIKFAGAKFMKHTPDFPIPDDIARLKAAAIKYKEMAHPLLIRFIEAKTAGGGYMLVFDWFDGESFSVETPELYEKFKALPIDKKIYVFEEILRFHEHVAKCGYVAMDFNDYSVLYNFDTDEIKICDIDFYAKQTYINGFGRALSDQMLMSPEEYRIGGLLDEITNVYTMGAAAFMLFTGYNRSPEAWPLNMKLYEVVKKAVSDERDQRQQSIKELIEEWEAASRRGKMSDYKETTERSKTLWNDLANDWDERMGENDSRLHREITHPAILNLLNPQTGEKILDAACGNGSFSRVMANLDVKVTAFDCSPKMIEHAKERAKDLLENIDFHVADATKYGELIKLKADKHFDKAVSNMAVMDIADIEPLFQAVYDMLVPEGIFVFSGVHPCFDTPHMRKITEIEDCAGKRDLRVGIQTYEYIKPETYEIIAFPGKNQKQLIQFHRPLSMILNICFKCGFVLDGMEEPVFEKPETITRFDWYEIPPSIILRLRKV
ncbi:MAG: phosphotransferase [Oscillospiraceae bacterium]|nr:phosphotransferase [Oscillospiraceae bacterium]